MIQKDSAGGTASTLHDNVTSKPKLASIKVFPSGIALTIFGAFGTALNNIAYIIYILWHLINDGDQEICAHFAVVIPNTSMVVLVDAKVVEWLFKC